MNSSLKDLTDAYIHARQAVVDATEAANMTKDLLMTQLEAVGLKSIKTDQASVSIVKKPVYSVNEREVEGYLKEQNDIAIDEFYITTMDKKKVLAFAEHQLKSTGEVVPGITASETEYLMVRENKEDK
jgi:hypothetical protein